MKLLGWMAARSRHYCALLGFAAMLTVSGALPAADKVRVGVLKFGTVNWELNTIQEHGLAEKEGIDLEVVPLASKNATSVAIQGDAVDIVVTDWVWVSRQRASGQDYTFFPYSLTVGGLIVNPQAGLKTLADVKGKRVGVAGGSLDKSWLLLRAYGRKELGYDLADEVEPNFGAPPLLNKLMMRGELDAVLNFWHFGARLKGAGMEELIGVDTILPALGVDNAVPLLGWVFKEDWAKDNEAAVAGFLRASYAAKKLLSESDDEWERLRPKTKAEDDDTLHALRDAYRAGVPKAFGDSEKDAAAKAFAILAKEGGAELVGDSSSLAPGTFWSGFDIP